MSATIIPRELAARHLAVSSTLLRRYEARGLIHAVRQGDLEGYKPEQLRRVWSVISLHREAGINLAGVECILRMREQLDSMQEHMARLADELRSIVEADLESND